MLKSFIIFLSCLYFVSCTTHIVCVHEGSVDYVIDQVDAFDDCEVGETFEINGFHGFMVNTTNIKQIKELDNVEAVFENGIVEAYDHPTLWGLDRINQRDLPLDLNMDKYYSSNSEKVVMYVLDSGIAISNDEFGGRALNGFDAIYAENPSETEFEVCNSHGTHVSGTIGGNTYGVANNVKIVNVRVLNCDGLGTYSGVILGMYYALFTCPSHFGPNENNKCIISMSLGGPYSLAVNTAVDNIVNNGIPVVVASGNFNIDACLLSPASASRSITVGASDIDDSRAVFSNYGDCVDIYAPGVQIGSILTDGTVFQADGTSMAAPHVSGVLALIWSEYPELSSIIVENLLFVQASKNKLSGTTVASENKLLYIPKDDNANSDSSNDDNSNEHFNDPRCFLGEFYDDNENTCKPCYLQGNCKTCSALGQCNTCYLGHRLHDNVCSENKPDIEAILEWQGTKDLDLHLFIPNVNVHIYWANKGNLYSSPHSQLHNDAYGSPDGTNNVETLSTFIEYDSILIWAANLLSDTWDNIMEHETHITFKLPEDDTKTITLSNAEPKKWWILAIANSETETFIPINKFTNDIDTFIPTSSSLEAFATQLNKN